MRRTTKVWQRYCDHSDPPRPPLETALHRKESLKSLTAFGPLSADISLLFIPNVFVKNMLLSSVAILLVLLRDASVTGNCEG